MKKLGISLLALTLLMGMSCKKKADKTTTEEETTVEVEKTTEKKVEAKKVKVAMTAKSESNVSGNVVFKEEGGVVTMTAIFDGLNAGEHAIHLHEKADCSAEDGTSSGGHWNPTFANHGKWGSPDGYHKGDIGNFPADENGNGTITFKTDEWCIGCGDDKKDILGKAVIVHQGTDDFTSQPSGAAGARVSCGGVIQ
ncbi:superoxide dismutase family protein [Galbibacter sp. EGI 63066]|uniref:superoxide dismutase family protein n=1 Tax=Galbibacter sp. EGI 63066 TaxID=2993559 RepID=UPI00224912FE|nr:superoxide dismutase family protein [Galbibacter sp. EGI 63066]MCX2679257.1 superoxide dismutase family protein [Galbibacter sp. EGI 63066]